MTQENIFKTNSDVILGFGVELEMGIEANVDGLKLLTSYYDFDENEPCHRDGTEYLICTDSREGNRSSIYDFLAYYLSDSELQTVVGDPENREYSKWQLDNDESVMEAGTTYRVEVVSPILGLPTHKPDERSWTYELEKLFACIERYFHVMDTTGASTHIHVAPVGRPWSQAEIVSIGKGINLISDIIPTFPRLAETERTAKWAKVNPQAAFNNSSTIRSVVQALCPDRSVAWNLRPMFNEPEHPAKGTIEFRRPPQSRSADEAKRCITITMCLVVLFLEENELVTTIGGEAASSSDRKLLLLYNLIDRTARRFGLGGMI
ncbi:hypothetical protein IQ07DRAFT_667614 [Pyrenochaeta sp. DS3sAY3a]|nr:hypothetical protein IQ07DRAFT_667614 [Pyrenochaeta sp. DS3sAY3a]